MKTGLKTDFMTQISQTHMSITSHTFKNLTTSFTAIAAATTLATTLDSRASNDVIKTSQIASNLDLSAVSNNSKNLVVMTRVFELIQDKKTLDQIITSAKTQSDAISPDKNDTELLIWLHLKEEYPQHLDSALKALDVVLASNETSQIHANATSLAMATFATSDTKYLAALDQHQFAASATLPTLAIVLAYTPASHASRSNYLNQFTTLAKKATKDAANAAALQWGINNGILDAAQYQKQVSAVWADTKPSINSLELAQQLEIAAILADSKQASIQSNNPSNFTRLNEVVEVPWSTVLKKLPSATDRNIGVRDSRTGEFTTIQVVDNNQDGKTDALLFLADFTANESAPFQLVSLGETRPAAAINNFTARYVPERKDDFTWENDRVGFRVYGPALAEEGARGGVDVWTKSVRRAIVNEWYEFGSAHYHDDNGTGLDGYKVGPSLGCGGVGYLSADGKFVTSPVYSKHKEIEAGPLRLKFQLEYAPVDVTGGTIAETRTISMLAGVHHFRVDSSFQTTGDVKDVRPVAGLVTRKGEATPLVSSDKVLAYWDNVMSEKYSPIGAYLINPTGPATERVLINGQWLQPVAADLSKPSHFFAGSTWPEKEGQDQEAFILQTLREAKEVAQAITTH